jgi:hypothetical protein
MVFAAIATQLLAVVAVVAAAAAAAAVAEEGLRTIPRLHQEHREAHWRELRCVQVCWDRNLDVAEVAQLRLEDYEERHDWHRCGEDRQMHFQDHSELQVDQK